MTQSESPFEKVRRKMVAARIEFMSQLARFSVDELMIRPADDEWSPLEIAHHVSIADGLALEEMKRVQQEENPLITNLTEHAPHVTRNSPPPTSLEAVLDTMSVRREEIFSYLSQLPAEVWDRPFRHAAWGERKFYQMVNVLPFHDQQHAQQLAAMKEA